MSFIDLHCHTLPTKTGDGGYKRDVGDRRNFLVGISTPKENFITRLCNANVSIVGITNHNYFDEKQYKEFSKNDKKILVLPGIELNVIQTIGIPAHCILISNPSENAYKKFKSFLERNNLMDRSKAEGFKLKTEDLITELKKFELECFIIIHYAGKDPSFSEHDYLLLKKELTKEQIIVEPSNLTSAFIYMNAGYSCLVGSDVKDWKNYPGKKLPELKIPISSFSMLQLLIKRDMNAIKNAMKSKEGTESIEVSDLKFLDLNFKFRPYKDINIIFGGKSTGKSLILKSIYSYLCSHGKEARIAFYNHENVSEAFQQFSSYQPSQAEIDKYFSEDLKGEFKIISSFSDEKVVNILPDLTDFMKGKRNKSFDRLGIISSSNFFPNDEFLFKNKLQAIDGDLAKLEQVKVINFSKYEISESKIKSFFKLFNEITDSINKKKLELFLDLKASQLANNIISSFRNLYESKKAKKVGPNTTGIFDLYKRYSNLYLATGKVMDLLNKEPLIEDKFVCVLDGKGQIFKRFELCSNPSLLNKKFSLASKCQAIKLSVIKKLAFKLKNINKNKWKTTGSKDIYDLIGLVKDNNLTSKYQLIFFLSQLVKENKTPFDPSSGDKSSLILGDILNKGSNDFDYYLLDEPEMSVGHDFVANNILPKLKALSLLNKTIIVVTHDANIGVCTLPYLSIFRKENNGHFLTFIGNPFNDVLSEINGNQKLSWKEECISFLEGGREMLNEREATYGAE